MCLPQVYEQANFWGCERILPDFPQTCPKSFCATFSYKSPTNIRPFYRFWYDLQKKVFMCFSASFGLYFFKLMLGAIFDWICRDFAQSFRDFSRIFDKSKHLAVCLYLVPLPPTPLCSIIRVICTRDQCGSWLCALQLTALING